MTAIDHTDRAAARLTRHWPALAGLALAVLIGYDLTTGAGGAPVVAGSAFVYLGAAALRRREAAWPVFALSFVLIGLGQVVPWFDPVWTMIGVAAVLAVVGAVRGGLRPHRGLPLQAAVMLVCGAVALAAAQVQPVLAGLLVAAALLAHAAWDVHHHRTGRVVVRSMAEFCLVLDVVLAALVLVVTFG